MGPEGAKHSRRFIQQCLIVGTERSDPVALDINGSYHFSPNSRHGKNCLGSSRAEGREPSGILRHILNDDRLAARRGGTIQTLSDRETRERGRL